jgi:thiamine biosynthesis lipoprotein
MTRRQIISSLAALLLVSILGIGGYYRSQFIQNPAHWGETMGTGYSVKISGRVSRKRLARLLLEIESALTEVNRQMSTWDPESEISRFNHSESTELFTCSPELLQVVGRALELSETTKGAFDPTLQPLLNVWGFGSEAEDHRIPTDHEIELVRKKTGWEKVSISGSGLMKSETELSLALGAIAKGYGVDAVAFVMKRNGLENWFIEIGGEVVVNGTNAEGVPWRIGIQNPTTNPMDQSLRGIIHLQSGAIATSGDYRNYIEEDGQLFSHILDPRTGHTVLSDTASVSVHAGNCMDADGIATALFVMGHEQGLRWVEEQSGVEALFLIRTGDGEIIQKISSGFVMATGYIETL